MKKRGIVLTISAILVIVVVLLGLAFFAKLESDDINRFYTKVTKHHSNSSYQNDSVDKVNSKNKQKIHNQNIKKYAFERYVFVGDSRYRGMEYLAEENDIFICENGRGYDFLLEKLAEIKSVCDENTALIIGLGVNDNGYNIEKYVETLTDLADTMDCHIFYMLVNPVDEAVGASHGYSVSNEKINTFNHTLMEQLDDRIGIIDTNTYLYNEGFSTQDGLHYTNETYEKIYQFIKAEITK